MILRRIILGLSAAAVLSTSAAVCVVALAFALYALVAPHVGAAGGGAIVAGAAALLIGLTGFVLVVAARPPRRKNQPATPAGLVDRVLATLGDKPVMAIAGAIAAGILAVRNPGYLGATIRAFMDGRHKRPKA